MFCERASQELIYAALAKVMRSRTYVRTGAHQGVPRNTLAAKPLTFGELLSFGSFIGIGILDEIWD